MNVNSVFSLLNVFEASKEKLFLIVDCKKETIEFTDNITSSSHLKDVGNFFINLINKNHLSSENIKSLQKSFELIKEIKLTELFLRCSKSSHDPSTDPIRDCDLAFQDTIESNFIQEDLGSLYKKRKQSEKKKTEKLEFEKNAPRQIPIEALFSKNEQFILNKLKSDSKDFSKVIIPNDSLVIEKIKTLISKISKIADFDDKEAAAAYRRLKQRILGGVRFAGIAKCLKYRISEQPVIIARKVKAIQSVSTKIRTTVKRRCGVKKFQFDFNMETLINNKDIINEFTLSKSLGLSIENYIKSPYLLFNYLNQGIDLINVDIIEEAPITLLKASIEHTSLGVYLTNFMEECASHCDDFEESKEIQDQWLQWFQQAQEIFDHNMKILKQINYCKTGKFNDYLIRFEKIPGLNINFSTLEMAIRNSIFECAKGVREKKIFLDDPGIYLRNAILRESVSSVDLNEKSTFILIKAATKRFLLDSEYADLFNKFFKKNWIHEDMRCGLIPNNEFNLSGMIMTELLDYCERFPKIITALNESFKCLNFQLNVYEKDENNSYVEIVSEALELLDRMNSLMEEIEQKNAKLQHIASKMEWEFQSIQRWENIQCNLMMVKIINLGYVNALTMNTPGQNQLFEEIKEIPCLTEEENKWLNARLVKVILDIAQSSVKGPFNFKVSRESIWDNFIDIEFKEKFKDSYKRELITCLLRDCLFENDEIYHHLELYLRRFQKKNSHKMLVSTNH